MDAYCYGGFHNAMNQPQVSVVIPVWNGERYLRQAIESILDQDFLDFELIIVDDGSTDGSATIAAEFMQDLRVKVLTQANSGVVAARNAGLLAARADLVAFLDSDDIAKPDRLTKQLTYLNAHPEIAVVGTHITYFSEAASCIRTEKFPIGSAQVALRLETGNALAQPSVMMRKSMVSEVGGYRNPFRHGAEDYDLWLRLSERHPLDNLPEALTLYRIHPESLTHRRRYEQTFAAMAAACAHRRRVAGMPDPLEGLQAPLSPADLHRLNLSEEEEPAFIPSLVGLLSGQQSSPDDYIALAQRAWTIRRYFPRGGLVRHCLIPTIKALNDAGRTREAFNWLVRAIVTEPLSTCWMLMGFLSRKV
jgi:hypothetical protein